MKPEPNRAIYGWLVFSNLHIAFVSVGLILGAYALLGRIPDLHYVVLAASGVVLVYHMDRAVNWGAEDEQNAASRLAWLRSHTTYIWVSSGMCLVGIGWGLAHIDPMVILAGAVIGILGLLYNVTIPFTTFRIKDSSAAKFILIIGCWVTGGVVLPLYRDISTMNLMLFVGWKSLYLIPNILMAEWVDRKGDMAHQLKGLGTTLTKKSILRISTLAFGFFVVLLGCAWSIIPEPYFLILEGLGMSGMLATIALKDSWTSEDVVYLDAWVGFPVFIWLFAIFS